MTYAYKSIALALGLALAPMAAHAELQPMKDSALRAVSGQAISQYFSLTGIDNATDAWSARLLEKADSARSLGLIRVAHLLTRKANYLNSVGQCNLTRVCDPQSRQSAGAGAGLRRGAPN
ncbi:MAG: hypothetical protein SVU69_09095 [Pseudomonadota bacterium]|nr:hypothetical protein [Pseudomonadota bacterium]